MSARTNLVLKSVQKYFAKHLNFVTRSEFFLKSYRSRGRSPNQHFASNFSKVLSSCVTQMNESGTD